MPSSRDSRPNGSPPPYESENAYHEPPQPAYSYYPDDEFQHFYRWTSPPGIIKIMAVIGIVLCLAIFACVASTLAWDTQGGLSGFGGMGGGGSYGGGGYGGYGGGGSTFGGGGYGAGNQYGYGGIGGNYNDPRKGKGFIIAMAAITFIATLAIFIIIVSKNGLSESRRFYLAMVVICAILALLMFIASIVYLMAVNPMAQSSGSAYGSQIAGLCAQYQQPQMSGQFVNQYLYHYCVVEPQEAIAVVCGFLVMAALIIMMVFSLKTRQKIRNFGKSNILWKKVKVIDDLAPPQDVEDWVNNVSAVPEERPLSDYPEKLTGSRSHLDDHSSSYNKPSYSNTPVPPEDYPVPVRHSVPASVNSDIPSSAGRPKKRRARRADGQGYETDGDYASSGDELDDDDFDSEFPPISGEQQRSDYKREFDRDHQEYKDLQAELDAANKQLSDVDRELDDLQNGSPQYLDALDEYNRLKDFKRSADYQMKKRRCKYLKSKLSHIKKKVSEFDRRA